MPFFNPFPRSVFAALGTLLMISTSNPGFASEDASTHHKKPANVLVLMFDDMRFDTFSYRGGPVNTPNIDALAAQSIRFDNAMSTTGLCSPSRAAFYTGKWGHKTGLDDNVELYHTRLAELDLSEGGLIRKASQAGYLVGHVGKWHLGARGTELRGAEIDLAHGHEARERFSRVYVPRSKVIKVDGYYEGELDANSEKHEYYMTMPGTYEDTEAYKKVVAGKQMIAQMARDERPFFGIVSFNQPHPAYRVPEPYASMYDPKALTLPSNHLAKRINKPMAQDGIWWPWHDVGHMSDMDWRKARAHYYGAIAMVDRIIGELLDEAKAAGVYDDLHIVLLGDQGSMLGEHTLYDKGPYAYDELMRMPLLIRDPDLAPRIVNRQVSLIDVTPTLTDIMQLETEDDFDGHSLIPLMEKGDAAEAGKPDTALYAYEWYNGAWFGIRAIRTPGFKFVWNPGEDIDELYDLKKDPGEVINQINNGDYRESRAEMVKLLMSELARTDDPALKKLQFHAKAYLEENNNEKSRH
ncbi:sulfatase-like hydrolase/transferase [Aestuariibacter sp. A3R04]|uniref:sulfatase-like hydrolase/transferase n=1 Tax=Aestuariibacter sp. A3R04 TaxID=2841571 RepID=UPI002091D014|nr:sulfatase-like hydrolase/transferase [Aestuariibacter sp. A3R04]